MSAKVKSVRQVELETLGVLSTVFLLVGLLKNSRSCLFISLFLQVTGLFFPSIAGVISKSWLKFAEKIGVLNAKFLLTLVYFLVLVPLALVSRWSGRDLLRLKRKVRQTMYLERNKAYSATDFTKTW